MGGIIFCECLWGWDGMGGVGVYPFVDVFRVGGWEIVWRLGWLEPAANNEWCVILRSFRRR